MAEQIESLISSQRRLIADISHELRSPLARLTVALGLTRLHANPECASGLDRIELEAERLNTLIGNLLRLARLEGGSETLEGDPVPLNRSGAGRRRRRRFRSPSPQPPRSRNRRPMTAPSWETGSSCAAPSKM